MPLKNWQAEAVVHTVVRMMPSSKDSDAPGICFKETFARSAERDLNQAQQGKLALCVLTAGHGQTSPGKASHTCCRGSATCLDADFVISLQIFLLVSVSASHGYLLATFHSLLFL